MNRSPGNALIVSTQRLSLIAWLSSLDVVESDRMPQSFVCSEAKCAHRWEPTGHQMTRCGVVAWSALGLRDRGEREKKGEQGAPDTRCPAVLVGCHDASAWSDLQHQHG